MSMQQYEPLHADRHRSPFNFTLVLALAVGGVGLFTNYLLFVIGMAVGAYSWFTTPSQYMIYSDRLVIFYGRPRVRQVFFQEIEQVDPISLPMGVRLVVRLRTGRRLMIQPRDSEEFQNKMRGAMESYHRDNPERYQGQEG